ncbi:UvrD/REP helicase [Legionella quinlivanii]|uniref:DNA 3'-5' helicase II n=1 Tax=Legionella quinlivanii TaxID=45073 RepID=A0A0W0Y226_9GAMM|nr:DNA/RNA helicase domain-containing protein [Legionella quinlivanii]KTD50660.1 UvrD/REP helicase [Legionella quinlivanii]SEG35737.1 RNA helicase [Legionella quinlivanii DSM 21216]STY11601.1 Uncharacterized conserved protein [Legionella quinlivanii]
MQEKKENNLVRWKRVFIDRAALAKYTKGPKLVKNLAGALLNSPGTTDYEPLRRDLASARLNKADRALIIDFEVDGECNAVIADIAENHDYNKSPLYSDKHGVEKYRTKYGTSIIQRIREQMAEERAAADRQVAGEAIAPPHPVITLDCYNQNFIRLNSQQESLLEAMLPALVSGAPGSGKSCVAISLITEFLSRLSDNPEARILYVTKSPELIEAMQAIWDALLLPEELKQRVEFKTYETVAREQKSEAFVGKSLARETDFEQWLKDHIPSRLHESRQIYEEFRLLSGYPGEYMGLGVKKSLYHNQADRQWILKTYEAYLANLEDQHKVALDFLDLKQQGKYDLVLGDEAQDLSGQELVNLLNLAKNGQICFCMDSHQSLFDSKSKRPFIFEMMHRSKLKLEHIELPHSYRCPADVVHFANTVIRIKNTVVGGSSDKLEKPEIKMSPEQANTPGMVHWLKQDKEELAKLREMARQSNFAIITLPQYVKEARDKYPGVMIFTPEQIKGLEYENVLLYRMLDDTLCHEASRELDPNAKVPVNRARRGCSKDRFGPPLNKFFTSCTRATRRLFVDQGKGHPLTMLCNELEKGIKTPDTAFLSEVILKQTEEERLAGWLEETCRLYRNGRKEMAEEAFNRWLKGNTPHADYTSFLLANELIKIEEPVKPSETVPAQESEKLLEAASSVNVKEDAAPDSNTVRGKRNANKGRRGRQRMNPAGGKPPAAATTASLSKNNVSGGLAGLLPNFFNSNQKSQEKLPISTGGNLGVSRLIDTIKTDLPLDEQTKLMSLFETKDPSASASQSSTSLTKDEKTQSDLNRWFEVFSDDWLDRLGGEKPQPEVILEFLFLIKNAGYDSFLSRLKSDNDKWMALKRSFTKNPEMTEFYFSLNELIKKEPVSGKSYFEILCRRQDGLDFLKEVLESLPVPEMLDKGPLLVLSVIFFGATANTEWDNLSDENNLLIFLLNSPSGRQVFKLLFTSQLFSGLVWKDKASETLLHWAVRNQRINVIVLIMAARDSVLRDGLLKPECDVWSIKNKDGLTPLELAQKNNLSNVIKALDPALYVRSSAKKATSTSHEPDNSEESLMKRMKNIVGTRGAFLLPDAKKLRNEINELNQEIATIRNKIASAKLQMQKSGKERKILLQLKTKEQRVLGKQDELNELCNKAKINALLDLLTTTLHSEEIYANFDLLMIGTVPSLLYSFLVNPWKGMPSLLQYLFEKSLKTREEENLWRCLEKYLGENPELVNFSFSLKELFKPFEETSKSCFEVLARTEAGLEFLVLIFKNLAISDTMKSDLQDAIGLSFDHDITRKSWGGLSESNSLLLYLLNRPQGRYLLSRLPTNIFYNLIRQQDSQSNSFLHWAAATQRTDLISMVLELQLRLKDGATIQVFAGIKNKEGQTALDIAKANQFEDGIDLFTQLEANQTVQPGLAAYSSLFHSVERLSAERESNVTSQCTQITL